MSESHNGAIGSTSGSTSGSATSVSFCRVARAAVSAFIIALGPVAKLRDVSSDVFILDSNTRDALVQHVVSHGEQELHELIAEAKEKGYKLPPDSVLKEAKRLFYALNGPDPALGFSVSPGAEGDISLDASVRRDFVLIICEPDGTALCIVDIGGEQSEKNYPSTNNLPDEYLERSFERLDASRI